MTNTPPTTMRAVVAEGGAPVLVERPVPTPGPDELLVRVHATALNRADLLQVRGAYNPPPGTTDILGLEFSGTVVKAPTPLHGNHDAFKPGDRVMALVAGGGYADYAVVHTGHVMRVPPNLDMTRAAAIPEAYLTAFDNLMRVGKLRSAGEVVLIHAGASSVGLAAIQLAKIAGCRVAVTASAGKHPLLQANGADLIIDYKTEDFAARVQEVYGGADVVLDMVGAPYYEANLRVLNRWGRLVVIGLMGGAEVPVNLGALMQKNLTIVGTTLRARTTREKADLVRMFEGSLEAFVSGTLRPIVWRTYPLGDVAEAFAQMRANANAGKIVLHVGGTSPPTPSPNGEGANASNSFGYAPPSPVGPGAGG